MTTLTSLCTLPNACWPGFLRKRTQYGWRGTVVLFRARLISWLIYVNSTLFNSTPLAYITYASRERLKEYGGPFQSSANFMMNLYVNSTLFNTTLLAYICKRRKAERVWWSFSELSACHDNMYIYIYIYVCIYTYTYVYICIYIYIYMYTYSSPVFWSTVLRQPTEDGAKMAELQEVQERYQEARPPYIYIYIERCIEREREMYIQIYYSWLWYVYACVYIYIYICTHIRTYMFVYWFTPGANRCQEIWLSMSCAVRTSAHAQASV